LLRKRPPKILIRDIFQSLHPEGFHSCC
jgi:hypothetical protein